jgi:hypothetical protein
MKPKRKPGARSLLNEQFEMVLPKAEAFEGEELRLSESLFFETEESRVTKRCGRDSVV